MAQRPRILILQTGGTIVSSGANPLQMTGYAITTLTAQDLIAQIPGLDELCDIELEQVANIDSSSMCFQVWKDLVTAIDKAVQSQAYDGLVITHGTDTLEETAFLLSTLLPQTLPLPIVITGAMRPATALSADGPLNLLNAILVASTPQSATMGVLASINNHLYLARDVTKVHPTNVQAFDAPISGPIGEVTDSKVYFYFDQVAPKGLHIGKTERFLQHPYLPRVDILYDHADQDAVLMKASIDAGAQAIVLAGTGNGSLHQGLQAGFEYAAQKNVTLIRASRTGAQGLVTPNRWVHARYLNAQKARLLAQLALIHGIELEDAFALLD